MAQTPGPPLPLPWPARAPQHRPQPLVWENSTLAGGQAGCGRFSRRNAPDLRVGEFEVGRRDSRKVNRLCLTLNKENKNVFWAKNINLESPNAQASGEFQLPAWPGEDLAERPPLTPSSAGMAPSRLP